MSFTSQSMSLMLGRSAGSLVSSAMTRAVRGGEACTGGVTGALMIFMINAHWFRASKGCANVQHWQYITLYRITIAAADINDVRNEIDVNEISVFKYSYVYRKGRTPAQLCYIRT